MKDYKLYAKVASTIRKQLFNLKYQNLKLINNQLQILSQKTKAIQKSSHGFDLAVDRNWLASANKLQIRIKRNIDELASELQKVANLLEIKQSPIPKGSDIIAELLNLENEFDDVKISRSIITVITTPITLEEVELGRFEINLYLRNIKNISSDPAYKIVALEPNPAGSDDNVTHPHVSHEKLCEGDGHHPIRNALTSSRLCDFFTIVHQILQTYNPDSPYVAIDDWEGVSCYDCSYTTSEDERYYCESCDNTFCESCSTCCVQCDNTVCLACSYECPGCETPVCQDCTDQCSDCERTFCNDCLNDDNLCLKCEEKRKENSDEDDDEQYVA
ncbi:MAG: hypothetical protein JEZ07_16015 [Phycisphaerae bacterium]|nr:hypothetical protein [Phycisphaerae bacterium]